MATNLRKTPYFAGFLVICAVAALALGPHVFTGGFHADDWINGGQYRFHPGSGLLDAVRYSQTHARDVWSLLNNAEYAVFGMRPAPFLALTVLAAVAEAGLFLLLARRFGVPVAPATATALIVLLLPAADTIRLWASGPMVALFSCTFLLAGLLVALRGLDAGGRRGAVLHAGALVLYALSVNGYELGAGLILLLGLLYLPRAASRTAALWRWAADVAIVLLVLVRLETSRSGLPPSSLHDDLVHAREMAKGGLQRAAEAIVPLPSARTAPVLLAAALVVAIAGLVARRSEQGSAARREFRLGVRLIATGAVSGAAAWAILIPAPPYFPGLPGLANRINGVSALGLAIGAAGMAVLVALLIRVAARARAPSLAVLATALLVPVIVGDFVWLRSDSADWDRAADRSRTILARVRDLVPSPPPGATLFTFGEPGFEAPAVYVFAGAGNQDLLWAVRLMYGTESVSAYPVYGQMRFSCSYATMFLDGASPQEPTPYGRALLVDLAGGRVITPRSRADCLRESEALRPYAPIEASG